MTRNLDKICDLECRVIELLNCGKYQLDSEEGGALVDELKDLADAKKNCYKAEYYKEAAEELERAEMRERYNQDDPMGYDNWRYSSGRFAPKGRGHYAGYIPEDMMWDREQGKMGYPRDNRSSNYDSSYGNSGDSSGRSSRRGYIYDDWKTAKMSGAKDKMGHHTDEYLMDTAQSVKEMWADADPDQRKKMKANLTKLVGELA